jgi:DNA-binding MarR family transcriptional regulator
MPSQKKAARPSGRNTSRNQYVLEQQVGFLLRAALRRHTVIFTEQMVEGLTPPQFSVLAKLLEAGTLSQNYLGRLINSDSSTIKDIVDRMESKDLLETNPDPSDLRVRAVTLTPKGRSLAEAARSVGTKITEDTLAPLSAAERLVIVDILQKIS